MKHATALLLAPLAALHGADVQPPFCWDHVPRYAHVGKQSDDFTSAQLVFLAKHFDCNAIEKSQASRKTLIKQREKRGNRTKINKPRPKGGVLKLASVRGQ